jgi:hypothetical protein
MLAYCTPLLGARLTFISGQNLGKIVLGKLFDLTQLGYFSFAFQTVERFVELASTLSSALMPSLTQLVARGERDRMRWVFDQAFRLIQVVAGALSLMLFVFAPELTRWVGSPLFAPAVPLLRILALAPLARTAHLPLNMMFHNGYPKYESVPGGTELGGNLWYMFLGGTAPGEMERFFAHTPHMTSSCIRVLLPDHTFNRLNAVRDDIKKFVDQRVTPDPALSKVHLRLSPGARGSSMR